MAEGDEELCRAILAQQVAHLLPKVAAIPERRQRRPGIGCWADPALPPATARASDPGPHRP